MKRKIILTFLIIAVSASGIGYYIWNKKPATAEGKEAYATLTADSLIQKFSTNEELTRKELEQKVIQVSGVISEVRQDSLCTVIIETKDGSGTITCGMIETKSCEGLALGNSIAVKGICAGFKALKLKPNKNLFTLLSINSPFFSCCCL